MYDYTEKGGFLDIKYKMKCYGSSTVGERGQVVLPVEIRKLFGIKPGDKLIVMGMDKGFQSIALMKSEDVTKMFEQLLNVEKTFKEGGKNLENLHKEGFKKVKDALKEGGFGDLKKATEKAKRQKTKEKK